MTNKEMIKRGIALASSLILLSGTTVMATNGKLSNSYGSYAVNAENGSVYIDTDDIEANAQAIAGLQGQLGGLSFKFATEKDVSGSGDDTKGYYWSKDPSDPTGKKWVKVGAVGSAVSSDVLVGKKFSSESGVDIEGSMPNPTSANVSATANPTTNLSVGSETVTINNGADTTDTHDTNITQINLGVGEQITIPHGYYNKDIVISNGVSNRGSLSEEALYIDKDGSEAYRSGYYSETKLSDMPSRASNMHAIYGAGLISRTGIAQCSNGCGGQWDSFSCSVNKTDTVSLFDCNGKDALLNTLTVYIHCTSAANWGGGGSQISVTVKTDTGVTLVSQSISHHVDTYDLTGRSFSQTYNMFGYNLSNVSYLIVTISGYASGYCYGNQDCRYYGQVDGYATANYLNVSN